MLGNKSINLTAIEHLLEYLVDGIKQLSIARRHANRVLLFRRLTFRIIEGRALQVAFRHILREISRVDKRERAQTDS